MQKSQSKSNLCKSSPKHCPGELCVYFETHSTGYVRNEEGYEECTRYYTFAVHVPTGYDGGIFGVYDKSIDLDEDAPDWYIHERYNEDDFLLFRMD